MAFFPQASGLTPQASATRREWLRHGFTASLAAGLGNFLALREAGAAPQAKPAAESCILIFLNGGMSHLDTFDMKPEQPAEIRGEFGSIATSEPGLHVCEHLPKLAAQMRHVAQVRSVGFEGKLGNHSPACYHMLTGKEPMGDDAVLAPPRTTDQPTLGAAVARLRPSAAEVPAFVTVPDVLYENVFLTPGQFAGWLGSKYEAFQLKGDPSQANFSVPALSPHPDVSAQRMLARRDLQRQVIGGRPDLALTAPAINMQAYYHRAYDLLSSRRTQAALDIGQEPAVARDRYGMSKFGQSVLLARRVVEAGVRFVNVHWPNVGGGANWDTHSNGFRRLQNQLLPPFDRALSALLEDLTERGMLESTLIVVLTEFGRAPYIGRTFQNAGGPGGRDHWSNCFTVLLAGGGIPGGACYGASDAKGAFPSKLPLAPADLVASIYQTLGIDPRCELIDAQGRPHILCDGTPLVWA